MLGLQLVIPLSQLGDGAAAVGVHRLHRANEALELPEWPASDSVRAAHLLEGREAHAHLLRHHRLGYVKMIRQLLQGN